MARTKTPKSSSGTRKGSPGGAIENPTSLASTEAHDSGTAEATAPCGCALPETGRKAVGVDPELRRKNLAQLKRIEGQVRGLIRMVEEDRYCADIVVQIGAAKESLRTVGRRLLRNHLQHCVAAAVRGGDGDISAIYDEVIDVATRIGS